MPKKIPKQKYVSSSVKIDKLRKDFMEVTNIQLNRIERLEMQVLKLQGRDTDYRPNTKRRTGAK